jgi:small-conductance mechanosensitive channel
MELFGVRLIGFSAETGHKLLLTAALIGGIWLIRAVVIAIAQFATGRHPNERLMFWARQGVGVAAAVLSVVALLSIWFDDPQRLATTLGFFGAGLAFAMQRVVTALAGYVVIMRGNTFTVGDRITMGGVRGDVIALSFMQTKIMEMGQPPPVQGADPAMWVRSRQFTGRIVTVTNDKVFDEPVYNYTREFPFIWEEMSVPIPYRADRVQAERILLACTREHVHGIDGDSLPVRRALERRYFLNLEELTPRVFYRLTDNWLELTVRFIVGDHAIRDAKDAIARETLRQFEAAGIELASTTYEIVHAPTLHIQHEAAGDGHAESPSTGRAAEHRTPQRRA